MKGNTDKKPEVLQHTSTLLSDENFKLSDSKTDLQRNSVGQLKNSCTLIDKETKKHTSLINKKEKEKERNYSESNISSFMVITNEDAKIKQYINQMGIEIMKQNQEEGLISHNFNPLTRRNSFKESDDTASVQRKSIESNPPWSPCRIIRQQRKTTTTKAVSNSNLAEVKEVKEGKDSFHLQIPSKEEIKFKTPKLEARNLDFLFKSPRRSKASKFQKKIDDNIKTENIPNYDNCDSSLNALLFSKQILQKADDSTTNQEISSTSVIDMDKRKNSIKGILGYTNPIFDDTTKIPNTVNNIKPCETTPSIDDQDHDSNRSLKEFCTVYDSLSDDEEQEENNQIINYEEEDRFVLQSNSLFKKLWSYIVVVLIFYSLTFAPYYMAFQESESGLNLYFDVIIDLLFLVDIGINFFSPYYDTEDKLVVKRKMIAINYLKNWFAIDLISSFPFGLLNLLTEDYDDYSNIKRIMRISRLYRLFKWLKIFRIIKLAKKQNRSGLISFQKFVHSLELNRVLTFLFIFLIMIHVSSCLWIFIGFTQDTCDSWISQQNLFDGDNLSIYIASIYFNFVTVFTIGYGDIVSFTCTERLYNIFLLFIGVLTFSFALSSLSAVFADMDRAITKKEIKLVILEDIKDKYHIPGELYLKLKKSIRSEVKSAQIDRYQFIDTLPASIKNDLILTMHRNHIKQLQFFKDQRHDFIIFVIPLLRPHVLKQEEVIFSIGEIVDQLVLVIKGCLGLRMGVTYDSIEIAQIGENDHFGDILMNQNAQSPYEARARVHSEVMILKQEDFDRIKDNFIDATNYILSNSLQKMELIETRRILIQAMNQSGIPTSKMITILKRMNVIILERNFNNYYYNDQQLVDFSDYISQLNNQQVFELISFASEGIICPRHNSNIISLNSNNVDVATYQSGSKHATIIDPTDLSAHDNDKKQFTETDHKEDPILALNSKGRHLSTKNPFTKHLQVNFPEPEFTSEFTMKSDNDLSQRRKKTIEKNKMISQKTQKIIKEILLVNKWKNRSKKNTSDFTDEQNEQLENEGDTMDPITPQDNNRVNQVIIPQTRKSIINLNDDLKLSLLKRKISLRSKTNVRCFNVGENPQFSKIKEDIEILGKLTKKERRRSIKYIDEETPHKNKTADAGNNNENHRNENNLECKGKDDDILNLTFQREKSINVNVASPSIPSTPVAEAPVNVNLYSTTQNFNTNIIFVHSDPLKDQKSNCITSIPIPKIQTVVIHKLIENSGEASEEKKVKIIEKSIKRLNTIFSLFKLVFGDSK